MMRKTSNPLHRGRSCNGFVFHVTGLCNGFDFTDARFSGVLNHYTVHVTDVTGLPKLHARKKKTGGYIAQKRENNINDECCVNLLHPLHDQPRAGVNHDD